MAAQTEVLLSPVCGKPFLTSPCAEPLVASCTVSLPLVFAMLLDSALTPVFATEPSGATSAFNALVVLSPLTAASLEVMS